MSESSVSFPGPLSRCKQARNDVSEKVRHAEFGHVNPAASMVSLSTVGHVGPTYILRKPNRSGIL